MKRLYQILTRDVVGFVTDYYDEREEIQKDIWYAGNISGVRISA